MLEVEELTVAYGDDVAVRDLSFTADDGEVVCIIGPSGCGKSTLLRAIAGLVPPRTGTVRLDGEDIGRRRPDQRGVGLMFQDNALFPHRTVGENVAFGPRMHGLGREQVAERVREALTLVDLVGTSHRPVTELSGGEQQRVALARAIAPQPRLLMLDEPLGSLDRALRDRLLDDLPDLFAQIGTTVVYVTHDQDEALALADQIAVMAAGRIEQFGTPGEVWRTPRTTSVARFLGLDHVLDVEVAAGTATTAYGPLPLHGVRDGRASLVLLPDALRLVGQEDPIGSQEVRVPGAVTITRFAGTHTQIVVQPAAGPRLEVAMWRGRPPEVGDEVCVAVDLEAIHVLSEGDSRPHETPTDGAN